MKVRGRRRTGKGNQDRQRPFEVGLQRSGLSDAAGKAAQAESYVARLAKKHGKAKAISILAARIGRTVYLILRRKEAFDATRFLALNRPGGVASRTPNWDTRGASLS